MTFEIIKKYQLPKARGLVPIYPFASMEVGDGFEVPDDKGLTAKSCSVRANNISGAARAYRIRANPDAKFTIRTIKERGVVACVRVK